MKTEKILKLLTGAPGVSGDETAARSAAGALLAQYGPIETDPLGSLICRVVENPSNRRHLLLDAHIDQIGLIVTRICDDGFLKVAACGGVDSRTLLASDVTVHGKSPLPGVVASIPPHLQEGTPKNVSVDDIYIDVGLSKENCEKAVSPGDRVTFNGPFTKMHGEQVRSAALDNRAGCAVIIKALEYLKKKRPDFSLTVLLSMGEELHCVGAGPGAFSTEPTEALVVDVSFAHTPDAPKEKCGKMGGGPMIGFSPILSREMRDRLCRAAQKKNIPFQHEIMGGMTGTNADVIAVSRAGVKCALLSVPLMYMHTAVEKIDVRDIENTARLMAEYIMEI